MSKREPVSSDAGRSLSAGDRLGPYEIVSPLGAGGMGEVYRARDTRLRREVAVKVLHPYLSMTPEHVERLAREARAAGSLNHPNIVAVFDVGTEGPVPYVVSELLEGESLRSRLTRGPLPYKKALEYGIQIAQALGAAHEKGLWHRDVKPGNIFVTADGRAKLLDFGLVKLKPDNRIGSQDATADVSEPGGIHGTLGYMSPEQVLGEPVDQRTDLFALGAVLYEVFAGVPAFRRASGLETTRAVLNEEPVDLLERNPSLPRAAAAVVQRCLEKNKEARFQSAHDLAFHLQQLREMATPDRLRPARPARGRMVALSVLAVGALATAAGFLVPRSRGPVPTFEQLTFRRGRIGGARFSSEGGAVVYSEAREGRPLEVWWLTGSDSPGSRLLGYKGSDVLAVRPGKLALSVRRRFVVGERFVGTLAEAPIGEGSPHELADNVEDADWDPSGRLVIAHSPGAGEDSTLECPPGHVLYRTWGSIRYPRFSRDGRHIAFLEDSTGRGAGGRLGMVDFDGKFTPLTEKWGSARGVAWSPAGDEIWFAAGGRTNRALRAVDLKLRQRVILAGAASWTLWDVALDGRILLSRDDERSALVGLPPGETAERDLSWFDTSGLSDLSDDGTKVLFADRFGIYIRGTDGAPPTHLGLKDGFADDFSADGKKVLATTESGGQLVILPAGPGDPTPLPTHGIASYRGAIWFPDGRRILFNGTQAGGKLRSYVQSLEGGPPSALTPENTWATALSPNGEWAAAIHADSGEKEANQGNRAPIELWPTTGGEPRPLRSSLPGERPAAWSGDGRRLWVFRRGEVPADVFEVEVATGQRRLWKKLTPPDASGVYSIQDVKVTPDGRVYFYSYKRVLSQLYAVNGLK
jgi:serine/threonine protein kinase/Tol biopolymer transport system component